MMRGLRFCLSITFPSEVDARSELKRERQTNRRSEARPIERDRLQKRVPRIGWTGAESIREGEIFDIEQVKEIRERFDLDFLADRENSGQAKIDVEVTATAFLNLSVSHDEPVADAVDVGLDAAESPRCASSSSVCVVTSCVWAREDWRYSRR